MAALTIPDLQHELREQRQAFAVLDDHDKYRRLVWQRGVKPIIARRRAEHGSGLGRHRWVVERTFAWLHNRRRLLVRTDRRDDIHEGFLALTCCLICWRRLEDSSS